MGGAGLDGGIIPPWGRVTYIPPSCWEGVQSTGKEKVALAKGGGVPKNGKLLNNVPIEGMKTYLPNKRLDLHEILNLIVKKSI